MDDLRELQRDYLADVRETIGVIRHHGNSLSAKGNFKSSFPALLFLAHQLKGSGGSLGFPRITDLARRMSEELNLFLDEEQSPRPSPAELAEVLTSISNELDDVVASAQASLSSAGPVAR